MKIAYITLYDVLNQASWSKHVQGICAAGYYMSKHLEDEDTAIEYLRPHRKKFSLLTKVKWSLYRYTYKKDYYRWLEPLVVKNYARQIETQFKKIDADIILSPESAVNIAYVQSKQPIVLWTDTTLSSLINFYPYMSNLCQENIKNLHKIEAEGLKRCALIIYTSEWAARVASQTYGIASNKIKVIPWGANMTCDRRIDDIKCIVNSRVTDTCKLLFIGVDWQRKGGDIALQVVKELNLAGLKTELTVLGCHPKNQILPEFVKCLGFVSKSTPLGLETMNKLFCESHFLILPSRAETFGHVFCEASSFGVPSLATNIAGVPTVVNGLNGKTFSLDAMIEEYCTYISNLFTDYSQYKKLAISSFYEYQTRLNWHVATHNAKLLMKDLV